ncbi:long-chain fatty acid outer membrane transporter [Marinomonas aquimarina]|uniref:Long-chain fatty acid outer membrane transporter n=1 Tax=Marinomonas aquimarina TaxID=295068 RepID=A0A1A8TGA3_9GAMM|nr:outer membrane protein transport protein [Marinomonas aquimarina]SBS32154.1 long-chain fatty acid outer membrane transporter [Marinomonas aquimarina]
MTLPKPLVLALAAVPFTAHATNGYFIHGTSIQAQGMAGVSIALAHDSVQSASNPASLIKVGDQLTLGSSWFKPERSSTIEGNGYGMDGDYDGNEDQAFWIPQAGFSRAYSPKIAYGVAVYANGGMNTNYRNNPFASVGASGNAGVDLNQLFITGSVAYQVTPKHSVGFGITHLYQRFKAEGIQNFAQMSQEPDAVSNNDYDNATGWGVRFGWQGQVSETLTLGATWSSKIDTEDFTQYRGLFAERGGFEVPESYGLGFAWQVDPAWTLAGDWEHIDYSAIRSINNPLAMSLGSDDGAGFGWQDMDVYKLGIIFEASPQLTLRAGYSHAKQPIPASQTFFNILAPGVIEDHVSIGGTWHISDLHSLTASYTHALENTVYGNQSIPQAFGGGEANLTMDQNIVGISWNINF